MASVKVTIRVAEKQLAAIRKSVAAGETASVSAFFQKFVAQPLDAGRAWNGSIGGNLSRLVW